MRPYSTRQKPDRSLKQILEHLIELNIPHKEVPRGFGCDLIIEDRAGELMLIEIKNPGEAATLTKAERDLRARFSQHYFIVKTSAELLDIAGYTKNGVNHYDQEQTNPRSL